MKYTFFILLVVLTSITSASIHAEENRGFSLSGLFKFKKAEEKDKYIPVEEEKKEKVVLTGSAGPKMPAVPAGSIKKEIIVKSSLPPKDLTQKQEPLKAHDLPPVTVSYNPKIPFVTLVFQNQYQQNLEPGHVNILEESLKDMRKGSYRGKIRIKSFSDKGQKSAIERAQKIRSFLISNGISLQDLDVQSFPNANQGNTIHIFLLGEG